MEDDITHAHKFYISEDLYEIDFGSSKVLLTPWHPTYIATSRRGMSATISKIEAKDLVVGQKVISNNSKKYPTIGIRKIETVNGYKCIFCGRISEIDTPCSGCKRVKSKEQFSKIYEIDEAAAWLAGFIITDGHLVDSQKHGTYMVMITQSIKNRHLLDIAKEIIESKWHGCCKIEKSLMSECFNLIVSCKELWTFMHRLGIPFGNKSKTVEFPKEIFASPMFIIESFLAGIIDGDGSINKKDGRVRVITGSEQFANEISILFNTIGLRSSYHKIVDKRMRFGVESTYYHVKLVINDGIANKIRTSYKKQNAKIYFSNKIRTSMGITMRSIKSIRKVPFEGYMYDLTCKNNHNYIAESIIISNTFCAGEIVAKQDGVGIIGVAPEASAFCGKVLYGNNKDASIHDFERILSNGIKSAVKDGCGIISMSLGMNKRSGIIEEAVNEAVNNGVLLFAAAGNEGMIGSPYKSYPAAFENVISVGAANAKDLPQWFTTYGIGNNKYEQPEVAIASLEYYWGCYPGNKYGKMQGTSMACPMMAGVALLWRQAMRSKNLLPKGKEVLNSFRKWLQRNTKDTNNNGWDSALGFGVLLLEREIDVD